MCMNIQELQTIVNYGIPLKVFIINNHVLGNTLSFQRVNGMQEVACRAPDYRPPDFVAVAAAYGIPSVRVIDDWGMVREAVTWALSRQGPIIFDAVHHDWCQYEPRISQWDVGIEDAYPFLPRDEFRANLIGIEPLPSWEKNI